MRSYLSRCPIADSRLAVSPAQPSPHVADAEEHPAEPTSPAMPVSATPAAADRRRNVLRFIEGPARACGAAADDTGSEGGEGTAVCCQTEAPRDTVSRFPSPRRSDYGRGGGILMAPSSCR